MFLSLNINRKFNTLAWQWTNFCHSFVFLDNLKLITTYPSFALDVVHLPLCAFADALGAPQFDANASVCVGHG